MIKVKASNGKAISALSSKIRVRAEMFEGPDLYVMMKVLQTEVYQRMERILGDNIKHFEVRFSGNQVGRYLEVVAIDDIGGYLYWGTKPHPIGEDGQVLASLDIDTHIFGPVIGPVDHPGQTGKKEEIEAEVAAALQSAIAFIL